MTQKKIKASDVIGNSYYIYTLTSTNNTPSLNSTINITCTVTNIYGQAVSNKTITLYQNTTSKGEKTTLSNGTATWNNISMTSAGLQVFRVENTKIEVFVDNKSDVGHTHTQYLTSSDISGKANTNDLGAVAFSNSYDDLDNKPNIPSNITVDTAFSTSSNNAIANSTVKNALDTKLDKTHTSYKGKNVVTNDSTGTIEFEEKNNHTHSQYLTSHQDISGKANTSHTHGQITSDGSNTSTVVTVASDDKVLITDTSDGSKIKRVNGLLASHISDSNAHSNIGSSANDTQATINTSIDTALGNKVSKSSTTGLMKNDGTVDTNSYLTTTNASSTYQPKLTSGTNIKTVNNQSLLGSGNITITGGGSSVTIDDEWISGSTNPVESQVIRDSLDKLGNDLSYVKLDLLGGEVFQVSNFTNPNSWGTTGSYTNGVLTLNGYGEFTALFPTESLYPALADLEFSFDYVIDDEMVIGEYIDLTMFDREGEYIITEDDIANGKAVIDVKLTVTNNQAVITSEATGDEWVIPNFRQYNPYTISTADLSRNVTKITNIKYNANNIIALKENIESIRESISNIETEISNAIEYINGDGS